MLENIHVFACLSVWHFYQIHVKLKEILYFHIIIFPQVILHFTKSKIKQRKQYRATGLRRGALLRQLQRGLIDGCLRSQSAVNSAHRRRGCVRAYLLPAGGSVRACTDTGTQNAVCVRLSPVLVRSETALYSIYAKASYRHVQRARSGRGIQRRGSYR